MHAATVFDDFKTQNLIEKLTIYADNMFQRNYKRQFLYFFTSILFKNIRTIEI